MEKVCSGAEYGSAEAEFFFLQSVRDSRNKASDRRDGLVYMKNYIFYSVVLKILTVFSRSARAAFSAFS